MVLNGNLSASDIVVSQHSSNNLSALSKLINLIYIQKSKVLTEKSKEGFMLIAILSSFEPH